MTAMLVTSKINSGLSKPVHSALPIPQSHIQTRMTRSSGAKLTQHSSLRRGSKSTSTPQRKSNTANETSTDLQIYTDWANHYLAKSGHKRMIRDLQQDIADGVLLAEIIQVVANEKIADINGYPESHSQMIENIDACLGFLAAKGVNIKGLCAEEIHTGNLKAIVGLFFILSSYKKQQQLASLKQVNNNIHVLQTACDPSASPAQGHSPCPGTTPTSNAPPYPVHIYEHEPHNTNKSSASHVMVDQGPFSSPVLPSKSTTSTKGWRSKSLNAKHSATSASLEVPPKVITQKSMLDKLKLFNSRPSSRASSITSLEDPEASSPNPNKSKVCPVHPEVPLGNQQPAMASNSSPKLAVKTITHKKLSRNSVAKIKTAERDKEKVKTKCKDKRTTRSSGTEQEGIMEEQKEFTAEPSTLTDGKKSSLIPKGTKSQTNTKKEGSSQSGIPKPGQTSKTLGVGKNSVALLGGKLEHSRGFRPGGAAFVQTCQMESKNSNSALSLVSTKGCCSQNSSSSITQTSNTNNIQLPQTQHSHPNMATVAPFMYRSQTDVDKSCIIEGEEDNKKRSVHHCRSIHTSLESLKELSSLITRLLWKKTLQNVPENPSVPPGSTVLTELRLQTASRMESEISRSKDDSEDPGSRDGVSFGSATGSHSTSQYEVPDLDISGGSEGCSSDQSPSEEKILTEKAQKEDRMFEAMCEQGHMYQLHLNQHTGAWDSIARVNEEILLTMLDIYENFKSEDSESRRLRTVKNIADLRQNLEETMSSLRQVTHISHSTLQTTFDACITTEISTRGSLGLASRSVSASPWRPGTFGPRLQAGDAPSLTTGYSTSKADMLDGVTTDSAGYVSDGDILGKSVKMDSAASGWDDSSSVSSGISDALETDELNTSSSISSYVNTPSAACRDVEEQFIKYRLKENKGPLNKAIGLLLANLTSSYSKSANEVTPNLSMQQRYFPDDQNCKQRTYFNCHVLSLQLQTDAEKRSAIGCNSIWTDELRRPDGCSDPGIEMETSSKWCNPSDFSDQSERSLTGCKPHAISQTGSWRQGMSSQLGITCPGTKTPTSANCSPLKIHSNGKTDDAKVSERSRFSPQIPTYEIKKMPSNSPHTPTNTFGFKKSSNAATITASGAVIKSGSATLGKIPKSIGFVSSRLVSKQASIDDGYLPPSTRTNLQYRSLPRPSRLNSSMSSSRASGRSIDASPISKGTATLPNPKSRSLARSSANQTDREKGVFSDTESLALGPLNKASGGTQCQLGRQVRGRSSDTSSPTLLRLFGSKSGPKPTSIPTSDNMKTSTIISNPHTTCIQTCALDAPTVSCGNTHGLLHIKNSTSSDGIKVSVGKEEMLSSCSNRAGTIRSSQSDRYTQLPQGRGPEDHRDWLNCHPSGGFHESPGSSPFSPASTLSSPTATRFNFTTIGSPTMTSQLNLATARPTGNHASQDGPHEQHSESRLRNATIALVEKNRTMSSSGSFREALEEVHGSSLSLVSNTSSVYSTAHLVAAFEQSLGNMTIRLQNSSITSPVPAAAAASDLQIHRQPSSDSVSSLTSHSSLELDANNKKKRKNWQAFGKKKTPKSVSSHSDVEEIDESSVPSSPRLSYGCHSAGTSLLRHSHSNSLISECIDCETETVMQLRSELRDKEMKLTDIRLEALSSAHQLDQLRESLNRMQVEIEKLKVENDRLRTTSRGSCSTTTTSQAPECRQRDFLIGCIGISSKTKWEVLDGVVRRLFKEYIIHVDPVLQLGLNTDSVLSYGIGDVQRTSEADTPELLPCGYLVGESDTISVRLKGVKENSEDALVFETLIPKPILQRYVSQLQEHRFVILSGPSGTGKSFLASRLAEHVVLKEENLLNKQLITSFTVDSKSNKEVKQYLCNLIEQRSSSSTRAMESPRVVIVENLHHFGSLSEIFTGLLNCKHHRCPYIIGTMHQTSSSTSTNLQLHHNFRWLLCANHTEPVKGFLGRFLRRKLLETEISSRTRNGDLVKIIEWIPWPRLFLSCPMDVEGSQVWFTDLWNYSIIPYMLEAVREGLQLYGRKTSWEDPSLWVLENYPWTSNLQQLQCPPLLRLRREDVGFDCFPKEPGTQCAEVTPDTEVRDPLINMLMRLKEASYCSGSPSDDNDSQQQK
ncbi:Neuron navigator 2 [Bagarius yarrelli]|uniref:Neuron navigator 3 n=1 Tax=Bagarius yarrelli TaxID=175774 RepID=A0A556V0N1_BAGYA|nr:Neuron navigator 2 [Bagarius yarrelli]